MVKCIEQEYSKGNPQTEVREIGDTDKRGTKLTFKPDAEIFLKS